MLGKTLFLVIITLSVGVLSVDVKKLYHEKDLSEYCKRRVIPSIFLGRHVVEASAFILHFTKLNLPYSCYISIRAESGSNLIMALTMSNDIALNEYCSLNSPQLLVYEIGETFGGYWGMLPEVMVKHNPPQKPKYYTLKTTTTTTETTTEEYTEPTTQKTTTAEVDDKNSQDFIEVEVPLVELSGHLEPGSEQLTSPFDVAAAFDYQYDVTPIPGVKYDTSILPLVQLSVRKQTDSGRRDDGQGPRYELDVIEQFTPDPRLILPHFTPNNKHRVNENRLMSFGKKEVTKIKRRKKLRMTTAKTGRYTNYVFPTTTTMKNDKLTRNSWDMINKLMEKLRNSKVAENIQDIEKHQHKDETYNKSELADNISNIKHNYSIYLQPNLSIFNISNSETISPFTRITKKEIASLPIRSTSSPSKKLTLIQKDIQTRTEDETLLQNIYTTSQNINSKNTMLKIAASNQVTSQPTNYETSSIVSDGFSPKVKKNQTESSDQSKTIPPVSLLDHESWENILQVAPSMAILLNQTMSYNVSSDPSSLNETHRKKLLKRKKRSIQAIAIENGRPHNITTRSQTSATTKRVFNVADMQEFARMVELKDDEVQGRVALRYLKQYVGPAIYNICGEPQLHNRHVHLFNSSRIVLSLQNFSLNRLSVVLTGARTLLSSEMRCSSTQLECQVSGARVCVDALAACDGVPNCGSYDIYDEDRLMCAVGLGLQRNVYLAAFTFLALLMTLCYAVHYWLRRCVPHVAEAFFVYKNGIENILYLDSIMRAPGDMGSDSRMFYRGSIFSSNNLNTELTEEPKNIRSSRCYIQLFRKIFTFFQKKEVKEELVDEHEMFSLGNKKTFSFAQMELSNISKAVRPTVDTSAQTGESLEMAILEKKYELKVMKNMGNPDYAVNDPHSDSIDPPIMINDSLITLDEPLPEDELSLMKFFRDSRFDSNDSVRRRGKEAAKMDFSTGAAPSGEKELSSIVYDGLLTRPGPSGVKVKPKVRAKISQSSKRLRFDETATTIPTPILFDDEGDEKDSSHGKQAAKQSSQNRSWRAQHLSPIREDDESAGKHRHFWESKGKKSKKSNVSLR